MAPRAGREPTQAERIGPARELLRLGTSPAPLEHAERLLHLEARGSLADRAVQVRRRVGELVVFTHVLRDDTRAVATYRAPDVGSPADNAEAFWSHLEALANRASVASTPAQVLERLARYLATRDVREIADLGGVAAGAESPAQWHAQATLHPEYVDAAARIAGLAGLAERLGPEDQDAVAESARSMHALLTAGITLDPATLLTAPSAWVRMTTVEALLKLVHAKENVNAADVRAFAAMNPDLALPTDPAAASERVVRGKLRLPPGVALDGIADAGLALLAEDLAARGEVDEVAVLEAVRHERRAIRVALDARRAEGALEAAAQPHRRGVEGLVEVHAALTDALASPTLPPLTRARLLEARSRAQMDLAEEVLAAAALANVQRERTPASTQRVRDDAVRALAAHGEAARRDMEVAHRELNQDPTLALRQLRAAEFDLTARLEGALGRPDKELSGHLQALRAVWPEGAAQLEASMSRPGLLTAPWLRPPPRPAHELEARGPASLRDMPPSARTAALATLTQHARLLIKNRSIEGLATVRALLDEPATATNAEVQHVLAFLDGALRHVRGDLQGANARYARAMEGPSWLRVAALAERTAMLLDGPSTGTSTAGRLAHCDLLGQLRAELARGSTQMPRHMLGQLLLTEARLRLLAGDGRGAERVLDEVDLPEWNLDPALRGKAATLRAAHHSGKLTAAAKVTLEVAVGDDPERLLYYVAAAVVTSAIVGAVTFGAGSVPTALAGAAFAAKVGLAAGGAGYVAHNLVSERGRIADAYRTGLAAPDGIDTAFNAGALALGFVASPPMGATLKTAAKLSRGGPTTLLARARADVDALLQSSRDEISLARREQLVANRLTAHLEGGAGAGGAGRALAGTLLAPAVLVGPLAKSLVAIDASNLSPAEKARARDAAWSHALVNVAWLAAIGGGGAAASLGLAAAVSRTAPVSAEVLGRLSAFREQTGALAVRSPLGRPALEVTPSTAAAYVDKLGPRTIEVFHIPGSRVPGPRDPAPAGATTSPLPSFLNQVGHTGIRVEGVVYNKSGYDGMRAFTLEEYFKRYPRRMTGTVYEISSAQAEALHAHYKKQVALNERYGLFKGNCSQSVRSGLTCAMGLPTRGTTAVDPSLASRFPTGLRPAFRTVYARGADPSVIRLGLATAANRGFIWGVPASASAATSIIATLAPDAVVGTKTNEATLGHSQGPDELAADALASAAKLLREASPEVRARLITIAEHKLDGDERTGLGDDHATRAVALALVRRIESASPSELLGARLEDFAADFKRVAAAGLPARAHGR